jgi:hypothetical protein
VVLPCVAACGFTPHAAGVPDDGAIHDDAPGDAPQILDAVPDAPPGQVCFGTLAFDRVCFMAPQVPTGTKNIFVSQSIDTNATGTCDTTATVSVASPCVIAADTIIITGTGQLHVTGLRPLILLATGAAGINLNAGALVDASSVTGVTGAAALASCAGGGAPAAKGGGAGGSFTELGGAGGNGDGDTGHGVPATALGAPTSLHGGCPGAVGGNNNAAAASGGGAVALVASKIVVDGLIAVGGAGGHASGTGNAGGNGGGAGGMVVLDAPALSGVGEVDARGGGGGEGRGGNIGFDGTSGYNFFNRTIEAQGGAGGSTGGDGGDGGPHGTAPAQTLNGADGGDGTSTGGGGGGGGAAGVIIVTAASPTGITYTPAAQ